MGGHVLMDSEYWETANWFSTNATVNDARRKDATTHELGTSSASTTPTPTSTATAPWKPASA
ncbi:hypothetical protein D3C59_36730 [Streptomyces sp. SHP22-7]|nr:hypothetical protein D3C59_36730 [Streptomyces sp. SHP22-7]